MHRIIGLTGYSGPLTITLVRLPEPDSPISVRKKENLCPAIATFFDNAFNINI